jgi:hypothetical protein
MKFEDSDFNQPILYVFLQLLPLIVSNVFPYIAISMLGYLMFCLVGRNYEQYLNIQICKRISITMLVLSFFSIAATVGLYYACDLSDTLLAVELNFTNMIVTVLLGIGMIVITSMPWKIYTVAYRRRYAAYQKGMGGK